MTNAFDFANNNECAVHVSLHRDSGNSTTMSTLSTILTWHKLPLFRFGSPKDFLSVKKPYICKFKLDMLAQQMNAVELII